MKREVSTVMATSAAPPRGTDPTAEAAPPPESLAVRRLAPQLDADLHPLGAHDAAVYHGHHREGIVSQQPGMPRRSQTKRIHGSVIRRTNAAASVSLRVAAARSSSVRWVCVVTSRPIMVTGAPER